MRKYVLLFCSNFLFLALYAQNDQNTAKDTTYWTRGLQVGLNFNQAAFSSNWKGGGVNSIAFGGIIKAKANYAKEKWSWTNDLLLEYGMVKNKGQEMRKTADRIFLDSKLGYQISAKWNFYASLSFLSQFDKGYKYVPDASGIERSILISQLFSPAYLTESVGLEWKPLTYFGVRFGAGTIRQTIVMDKELYKNEPTNYGVPIGQTVRNEMAFQLLATFDKNLATNLNLKASYLMFANYETLAATDHRLEMVVTAKINKYINTTLSGIMLYDQDQDTQVQISQVLALGILYSL